MASDMLGAAVTGLFNLGSQFVSNASSARQNRKNREWQEEMWNKNNAYNTPAMQMQRFKAAGLNPHLIYGQGSNGNSGAPPSLPPQRPEGQYNFADAISAYVSYRKQQTEIDNMKKAKDVMEAEENVKKSQTASNLSNAAKTDQEREQASKLFDTTYAQAQANLNNTELAGKKITVDISKTLADTKLTQSQQKQITQSIQESVQRIKNMQVDNDLKGQEIELKKLEVDLAKKGIYKGDPAYMRIMSRVVDSIENKKEEVQIHNKNNGATYKFKKFSLWDWFSK